MLVNFRSRLFVTLLTLGMLTAAEAAAQETIEIAYNTVDLPIFYIAKERGFYPKNGLDARLVFIPSTPTSLASLVAGEVKIANASGPGIANAAAAGANITVVATFTNTTPYDFVVQESVKSPEDLKGKAIGIGRFGDASDTVARLFIRALGLAPDRDVVFVQVGPSAERVVAFQAGRIAGFPSGQGNVLLVKGIRYKILMTTEELPYRFDFPFLTVVTKKSYLSSHRDAVKRVVMSLIEATHFLKTQKDESKKIIAKYTRQNNDAYIEALYLRESKLQERVPLTNRNGMELQIKEAISRKPGAKLRFEDIVDETIVRELEKSGFIDRVYKQ
jgi:ABC-type nitrate/sulfonate/bicarbonate transport system substrate-binding protein